MKVRNIELRSVPKTMGDLATLALRNNNSEIVVKLYIFPDGCLHPDSWICAEGWK